MKVKELIIELQKMPQKAEVCIFDWRKNLHDADDEGSSQGIEPDFQVAYENRNVTKNFVSLSFKNDDYKDDGTPDYGASILNSD